jgi:hypothetical protein
MRYLFRPKFPPVTLLLSVSYVLTHRLPRTIPLFIACAGLWNYFPSEPMSDWGDLWRDGDWDLR